MKSMTKLIVVAMLLVAALVVAPAAARNIDTSSANVFVGEERLNFTGPLADTAQLVHYSGEAQKSSTDKSIDLIANGTGGVMVDELVKGIPTGSYYARNATNAGSEQYYVNVQNPEATLDIMLASSPKDSVNGKSVTKETPLRFKFYSNVDTGDKVNIELTLPDGGVVTTYNNTALTFNANGGTQEKDLILPQDAKAGTYTALAKWTRDTDFFGKGYDSKTVTFEVLTKSLAITANKDSVVRGNGFTVTITGESRKDYTLFVKSGDAKSPMITPGQTVVQSIAPNGTYGTVKTNAGGTATVQFNTTQNTDDKTFTIRVEDPLSDKNDEVKVKVEAGSVTVTTSGTGTYYIGEEITLSGTCTEGDKVYLFLTGPNLATDGVTLTTLDKVSTTNEASFKDTADVNADDTWSKKWNTGDIKKSIDAGGYTIYAVSTNVSKADLSDAKYATASVNLRSGFITATTSGATVARGDELTISGTAQGNPNDVYIWIFGKNYYGGADSKLEARKVSVESDGSFEEKLKSADTTNFAAGQYFVVVQHPMGDNPGVKYDPSGVIYGDGINNVTLTSLQAPAAASALINALDSPNVPDTYVKLTFVVAEPNIFIDPIGTKTAGSKFTITGTTNLAVGDTLNVEVTSAAFQPGSKTEASGFSSTAGNAVVQKGDGANKWSYEVDATGFKPDQYIVKVEAIEAKTTATATFNVVAGEVTTPPAGNVTTTATTATTTTTTATTTTAATPTTTPGFGALVALAGLGAVAFLVLRRK
ncbi:MEMAR_RS02690 family S-layer glycoprotein [Methanoculleus sp. 10]|uniref:MEMAR_RS02690 family S-layer glycoprotein n=1 Tax=Methanoculleus sp. 10 TaxID=430615 RepID=UPI00260098D2|nr:MEMAR_RS02690 family S-layer glycoprotein [Methanoculleus sp. 10]